MSARSCKVRAKLARASLAAGVDAATARTIREACYLWQASEEAADALHGVLARVEGLQANARGKDTRGGLEELAAFVREALR